MSLRDRFRPGASAPDDRLAETRAAQKLSGQRGRLPIAPPPKAGRTVSTMLRPLLRDEGPALSEIKRRWPEIAGESFARATPERLQAGVLTLKAPGALAPFLQQSAPLLVERLKVYGVKVKSIRIEQRTAASRDANVRPLKRALTQAEETALAQALDPVADPSLKSALMRLGRAVKQG